MRRRAGVVDSVRRGPVRCRVHVRSVAEIQKTLPPARLAPRTFDDVEWCEHANAPYIADTGSSGTSAGAAAATGAFVRTRQSLDRVARN